METRKRRSVRETKKSIKNFAIENCDEGQVINKIFTTGKGIEWHGDATRVGKQCFQNCCSFKMEKPLEGWRGTMEKKKKMERMAGSEAFLKPDQGGREDLTRYY